MFSSLDFICDYCDRAFTRKYNLQTHIENCHMTTDCVCSICGQSFGSPAGMQLHYSRGHNQHNQPYPECDICGRIFTRKQSLLTHMTSVHLPEISPDIRCKHCNRTFATKRNLKRHINQLHNPNIEYPVCHDCDKTFKNKTALINHINRGHNDERNEERLRDKHCSLCDKSYINQRNLKRHIEQTHGEREEFKCDICIKTYTTNHSLKRHIRSRHATEDDSVYQCDFCDKLISGRNNLSTHVENYHEQEKENSCDEVIDVTSGFICEECNKGFVQEHLLKQHIQSEHSFQSFYDYCKKSLIAKVSAQEQEIEEDMQVEDNTYISYNCEYCTSHFSTVYELKKHLKTDHDKEYCLSVCNVCFGKFYTAETIDEHKKICKPPPDVNSCNYCDKLFTEISSLEFHMRVFHPQAQIADSKITSTITEDSVAGNHKCSQCDRVYFSGRSLKHHVKLKHTTDEAVECQFCGKMCSNKYYLASHVKIHNNDSWSKCNFCDKEFKSRRNIRRHIECTHLGMQRYKCIECETLFKEKRSLRKHVRTKHPNSTKFPQCHFCYKRFESAKSCKIHLKLLHSFNMNTYPCDLCSVSFTSNEALRIHLKTKHLAKDELYKCEECNLVFNGHGKFRQHNELYHVHLKSDVKKPLPRCIICVKDFSTRKTLKRHIKKFHHGFDVNELAVFGTKKRMFTVECEDCLKNFNDDTYLSVYQKMKHIRDSIIFKCETCNTSFNALEYSVQRYKMANLDLYKSKLVLSELCTAEMSEDDDDDESSFCGFGSLHEMVQPESTTTDIQVKLEAEESDSEGTDDMSS